MSSKICETCGHTLADGNRFCSQCGKPVGPRQWARRDIALLLAALALLLACSALAWHFGKRSAKLAATPPAVVSPATGAITLPANPAAKPSAAEPLLPPPQLKAASPILKARRTTRSFGPYVFRIQAHHKWSETFVVPDDYAGSILSASYRSTGGIGGHLRVFLYRGDHVLFDSGNGTNIEFSVPVTPGSYRVVTENTAMLMKRSVTLTLKLVPPQR